eukprot:1159936-Pelagomonas_calceolata.AAC.11
MKTSEELPAQGISTTLVEKAQARNGQASVSLASPLLESVNTAMRSFDKKLLLLKVVVEDHSQVLAVFLPTRCNTLSCFKQWHSTQSTGGCRYHLDNSSRAECGEGVWAYAFSGQLRIKLPIHTHQFEVTPTRLQIFRNHNTAISFLWLAVPKPGGTGKASLQKRHSSAQNAPQSSLTLGEFCGYLHCHQESQMVNLMFYCTSSSCIDRCKDKGMSRLLPIGHGLSQRARDCGRATFGPSIPAEALQPQVRLSVDVQRMSRHAFNRGVLKKVRMPAFSCAEVLTAA